MAEPPLPSPACAPPLSVSDVCRLVRGSVAQLRRLHVRGECESVTTRACGSFFDLRDCGGRDGGAEARLPCVAWASSAVLPQAGQVLDLHVSHFAFYAPRGCLQAVVDAARPVAAEGARAARHGALLGALALEGVLTRPRLPLPDVPTHLCVVTSVGSAAFQDIMEGVRARWPGLRVTALHSLVQGPLAAAGLASALRRAAALSPPPDLIICGRGGGSAGDLDAFNQEELVRAVVVPGIPVISAVGHESDCCLADQVADARAKTPTAAVELALPVPLAERERQLREARREAAAGARRQLDRDAAQAERCRGVAQAAAADGLRAAAAGLGLARSHARGAHKRRVGAALAELRLLRDGAAASAARVLRSARFALRELRQAPGRRPACLCGAGLQAARDGARLATASALRLEAADLGRFRKEAAAAAAASLSAARAALAEERRSAQRRSDGELRRGGRPVRSVRGLQPGDALTALLPDGLLELVVKRARTAASPSRPSD